MAHATPARITAAPASPAAPSTPTDAHDAPELRGPRRINEAAWREAGMSRFIAERLAQVDETAAAVGSLMWLLERDEDEQVTCRATGRSPQGLLADYDRANLFVAARLLAQQLADDMDSAREMMVRDRSQGAQR